MRGAHNRGVCPGEKVECYSCRLMGHFKGATACKGRSVRKQRANHMSDSEEEGNTGDKIGQVSEEFIWAVEFSPKCKTAELQLIALDQGSQSKQITADLLIDLGVYRTLLTEEHWKRIQPEGANKMPELKESTIRFVPYGTKKPLKRWEGQDVSSRQWQVQKQSPQYT